MDNVTKLDATKGKFLLIFAYLFAGLAALAVRLQLASGMGFDFLGVYDAPNSPQFRHWCGVAVFLCWGLAALLTLYCLLRLRGMLSLVAWGCPIFALIAVWLTMVV